MQRVRTTTYAAAVAAFFLLGLVLSACGDDDAGEETPEEDLAAAGRGFVGTVEGTDAFVALVSGGGEAVVYVCDGADDIAEWFAGPADEGAIELTNGAGAQVEATVSAAGYRGAVTFPDGERHQFEAGPADAGAGLLRVTGAEAESDGVVAGWIVDNDGEYRGSLRVRGVARTAPPAPGDSVVVSTTRYPVSIFLTPPQNPATPPGVPVPYPNTGIVATATG